MAQIAGKGRKAVRGIGEFQHLRGDKGETRLGVEGGGPGLEIVSNSYRLGASLRPTASPRSLELTN